MHTDQVLYLKKAGVDYKAAESPDLWMHLEGRFGEANRIGPRFNLIPAALVADLIARGEDSLLEAMVQRHRENGRLMPITQVIDVPYIVGIDNLIALADADPDRVLRLIDCPGTSGEHVIHVLPAEKGAIRGTHQVTVTGGLYADGHTAGYYDICPGNHGGEACAWLASSAEIKAVAREMEQRLDDIAVVTRKECEAMIVRVKNLLG